MKPAGGSSDHPGEHPSTPAKAAESELSCFGLVVPVAEGPGVMTKWQRRSSGAAGVAGVALGSCFFALPSGAQVAAAPAPAVAWAGFAGNAQHTAVATSMPQPFHRIRWRAKVDLHPVLSGRELLIHYGAPMITAANTALVPTRVSARAG